MNQVFLKTRELGDAIMQSEEYKAMKEAEDRAMANADAAAAMGQYMEARQKIEALLEQDSPDPEKLKKLSAEMDETQQRLSLIEDVQALTEARESFSGLIEQVNQVLKFIITGQMAEPESAAAAAVAEAAAAAAPMAPTAPTACSTEAQASKLLIYQSDRRDSLGHFADDAAVPGDQGGAQGRRPVFPAGRFLRNVLRGRRGDVPGAGTDADRAGLRPERARADVRACPITR